LVTKFLTLPDTLNLIVSIEITNLSKKLKVTLEQATKAQKWSRIIAYSFFTIGEKRGWVVNTSTRPLYPGKETRYPLYRRLGGPQGRSGRVRRNNSTPACDPRTI
jgi:hypothetical protein